jgi:hypothetical protein
VVSGAPTTIPPTATAVAVDVTVTQETSSGHLVAYPDGSQVPLTSSTNFSAEVTNTGYQIVPIGIDGKIAFYNSSGGTTHLLVDITGYYASDPTNALPGDQTYHPLQNPSSVRLFDTRSNKTNTNLTATGPVAAGSTFTATIGGVDGIPTTATAVAINLTAVDQSGTGIIEAYTAGTAEPTDTTLTYSGTTTASLDADISLGTGSYSGQIDINNIGTASTDVILDIAGYFTTDDTGQVYHTVNPTRLVDTRIGIGGSTGSIAEQTSYQLRDTGQNDAGQITTDTNPTFALMLTVTAPSAGGALIAYPDGGTKPGTSNVDWVTSQTIANLALVQPGTDGTIDLFNNGGGTIQLVVDCSGYFANN